MYEPRMIRCRRCDALITESSAALCMTCEAGPFCDYCDHHHALLGHATQPALYQEPQTPPLVPPSRG